jgi:N-methylhydantoinase B
MINFVPGSEKFNSRPVDPVELAASLPESLRTHTVADDEVEALDPLTYEVIRHRMSSLTNEMGEALKRMSGSAIVTDANDFDFAVSDELGQEVQVGLYNTLLVGAVDIAISWTLQNRADNPGIHDGDMFLCNDPWVGGGLHQSDVIVFQPVFHDGQLFAWTSAVAHQADLGGPGLGSFNANAKDVFEESLPTPPVKIVRGFELQEDVADLWVRRSRVPLMVGLDLRAKIGANRVGRARLLDLIAQYGPDTVKAVMKRMMDDAERRLREKLAAVPDGTWRATGHQDSSGIGDRNIHSITVAMTKKGGHLSFDFTGTSRQHGIANCTYAGMRGGVMTALLPILANDIPWSAGGLMRCFDLISEEGTVNNATFPAALCRAPIGPAWMTGTVVAQCLAQMLDTSPDKLGSVQAACCGTWDSAVIGGLDERSEQPSPFLMLIMESMSGGYGAQAERDGIDTGGLFCVPMGRVPDVEMT